MGAPTIETLRAIDWQDGAIVIIDQTLLPGELRLLELRSVDELIDAIERLAVRGAPALGVAGALGVALATREHEDPKRREQAIQRLRRARPTAVNLARGIAAADGEDPEALALAFMRANAEAHRRIARRGADVVLELARAAPRLRLQTHCNTGALACGEHGSALGVIAELDRRGRVEEVLVDETRPLLQGSRLTTWELRRLGIAHRLICDAAGPAAIAAGMVDAVIVGADRIVASGEVVNKVGTYALALAAARAGVPLIVAAPESTLDTETASGAEVEIELRAGAEVLAGSDAPPDSEAFNPAFDITPADLVSALVTEERTILGKP